MAIIHDLINQIQDDELRARLGREVAGLLAQKKFGLVFEEHLPECTPLYGLPVSVGSKVARAGRVIDELWVVLRLEEAGGGVSAHCENLRTGQERCFARDELVVVAEFGEPVHPYLQPVEMLQSADQDAPPAWHTLIEADNYHALQLLTYLYTGKVDCIYIDPPYNTGARDWKYNNDYVDAGDQYRHSKWLSMMEKRLKIAKKLLNPADSVLICTIDEKEYLHLGCLLEELFPDARMQMVSSVINPKGSAREFGFSRTEEYLFFIFIGNSKLVPTSDDMLRDIKNDNRAIRWASMQRSGSDSRRFETPNLFYPIFFNIDDDSFHSTGESLPLEKPKESIIPPAGTYAIFPLGRENDERRWQLSQETFKERLKQGYVQFGKYNKETGKRTISYLSTGVINQIEKGIIKIIGREKDNTVILDTVKSVRPMSIWNRSSHSASEYGSSLIQNILPNRKFPYPKSLYAVRDALRFFVAEKPDALILDFFAGSGTTLHAVNLLNSEDGGRRRCVLVTNNEVSEAEAKALRAQGLRPGDADWERLGIARHVTWPRTVCSLLGRDVNGQPLKGVYLDSEREMAQGFAAHAAFLKLGFLDKGAVAMGWAFFELLAVLWMKAGCVGRCPDGDALRRAHVARVGEAAADAPPAWLVLPENGFAVLADERAFTAFADEVNGLPEVQMVFLVTDSTANFYAMRAGVAAAQCRQLYRDYLDNFRINTGA